MSSKITSTVLPIQRVMAAASPSSWRDGIVTDVAHDDVEIAFLDGATAKLRVVGLAVGLVAGEPVAYHPVAEVLHTGRAEVTARASSPLS